MFLAGDIGGTKTNLGLFASDGQGVRKLRSATFASGEHPGLLPILRSFLADPAEAPNLAADQGSQPIRSACFGIAGPVRENRAETPNLPWIVSGAEIAAALHIPRVALINDLVAMAEGIPALASEDFAVLQAGLPDPAGNAALVAAGTGFGVTILAAGRDSDGGALRPLPSEGGHSDFAARTDDEIALLRGLRARFDHVSVERVVSGPGLVNVYQHLRSAGFAKESPELAVALGAGDPAQVIGEWAAAKRSPLCSRAIDLFLAAYGAAAGNVALTALATRGVYLGGGIAPKLLAQLRAGGFMAAFRDKGRSRKLLEAIPVAVMLNPETALLGAARRAMRLAAEVS